MDDRVKKQQLSELEEQLALRSNLQNITNRIHAAQNVKQILVDLKDGILSLFNAYAITIYVADHVKKEIYSMILSGTKLKEIRLPIHNSSIAGYVANNKRAVNIADAYDERELRSLDKELTFDSSWDRKSGFKTMQVLAVPILHEQDLMGVIQIINRKGGGRFTVEEKIFIEEISEVLGIALYNQQRMARRRKTRFDFLVSRGLLSEQDLDSAWPEARKASETMEEYLMKKFRISKADIGKSMEDFYRSKFVEFNERQPVPEGLLANLRQEYLRRELWVPLEKMDGKIMVLVDDPNNILKRDTIESLLKSKKIEYCVGLKDDILKYIDLFFRRGSDSEESFTEMLGRLDMGDEAPADEEDDLVSESDSVIMQLVNKIIHDANARRASDIHIEPSVRKKNVDIRFRIDGDCVLYQTVPFSYRAAVVSRLKIMSNLDITERRLPQDGKIKFKRPGTEEVELRIATVPTQGNVEDVVMRILAKGQTMTLEQMSMSPRNYEEFLKILGKPYGIVLVVGPTGSGKTTTLHAALHHINTPDMKIWTAEDPVEITQEGLRQVQVNPKIGFDFSAAMRSFLRADPDVIMVGEMRDFETAKTGVEASLTGHLVFSTLHTNSATETIVRLLDMGIDPFNFSDSLLGILAQRLVRTLCKKCKEAYHPTQIEFDEIVHHFGEALFPELNISYRDDFRLFRPKGCSECNMTGYRGRMGVHELLVSTDSVKRLVTKREPVEVLRDTAISEGMRTLLQDGVWKVVNGYTDFKQVLSVCMK
jgi:type II secretory ATPase GspE/PulE/Tfp pilus assembly ATPase PilB-like protein